MEDRLRDALAAGAGRVQPAPDALPVIRSRIAARRGRRRRVLLTGAATLAVCVATVAGTAVLRAPDGPPPGPVVAAGTPPATARLPVYWIGATGPREVLFREFRTLPVTGGTVADRVAAAVTATVAGAPLDPDYRSGWPAGVAVRAVDVGASTVTVDLTGLRVDDANPSGAAAMRQLVWTVTAVSNLPGVRLRVDGAAVDTLWSQVPVGGTLRRADDNADHVLAPVWLISPQHGDAVDPSFDVQVAGFVADGRVRLQLRDASGAVVVSREVTLDATDPHQGDALVRIDLPAGWRPGPATLSVTSADGGGPVDDHVISLPGPR